MQFAACPSITEFSNFIVMIVLKFEWQANDSTAVM